MTVQAPAVSLDDKYAADSGRALMSGIQALVRLTLEQRRMDAARGLDTRGFVSGYQGSPLGGVNTEMGRAKRFLEPAGVLFKAGLNEELAATAVAGTQLLRQVHGPRHDGVTGYWYGKNPGLDRAADAIRHGNVSGTSALGGAVAWIGDDPASKSSTVPSSCEPMCQSLAMPLLAPGSVAEIVELGLHAVALSRASGLWAGLKIVADIADASATVDVAPLWDAIPLPQRRESGAPPVLVGPTSLDAEHEMLTRRLDAAREYARQAGLNRVTFDAARPRLGVVASGMAYAAVERALEDLGLDAAAMDALGLRLVRLAMPFPLDAGEIVRMLGELEEVLVVEDKTPFVEAQIKSALYGRRDAPRVVGRHDEHGTVLLTARGALGAEDVASALGARLGEERLPAAAVARLRALRDTRGRARLLTLPTVAARSPYFCSGCPHNISTRDGDDTLVGVGIGCHSMVVFDRTGRGQHIGPTQMGGEGAQWLGLAPFAEDPHFVQNLGDGTFHHSGSLAIRAAVAGGVNITYKLLYNDAVAMTGGQRAEGRMDVPTLTRWLALEGVRHVVVTTADPGSYRGRPLDPIASVRHRDDFAAVEAELAAEQGVTVLIHDDRCAAEERRLRKRGRLPTPAERVFINERVCEGCGDCGEKSTCLSVQPVETELGRKTRIHQGSCNSDFSCLRGDCPSFLLVEPGRRRARQVPALPVELPAPSPRFGDREVLLRMPGIGGTGVVTVSQILQMAAHLDGGHAAGLEQVGLAQKGGPVVSDVRIARRPVAGALRASRGTADVLVAFDVLGAAAAANLAVCDPERTVAVVNTAIVPTAAMVTGKLPLPGSPDAALRRIDAVTRAPESLYVDASTLAERLFGDNMPTNMILVGAVFQHGCLPIGLEAIEQAIRLNGAAVEQNLAAFRWGRALAVDAAAVEAATAPPARPAIEVLPAAVALVAAAGVQEPLRALVTERASDLVGFQSAAYARDYVADVERVARIARERGGEQAGERIAAAYARGLHKLLAYKDEYEVARLHLDAVERARLDDELGEGARVTVLLHPPLLRAIGLQRKLRLRRTASLAFRVLAPAKRLRGTPLDLFGYAHLRRVERRLPGEYRALMDAALAHLDGDPATAAAVEAVAELPELVRGYEHVKVAAVERFRQRGEQALAELAAPPQPAAVTV